jgi:hypothetical protein
MIISNYNEYIKLTEILKEVFAKINNINISSILLENNLPVKFEYKYKSKVYIFNITYNKNKIILTYTDKIKIHIIKSDKYGVCLDLVEYYILRGRSKKDPDLNFIREMFINFDCISLYDISVIKCDNIEIPFRLLPFVNYKRLQLYEDIVITPPIAIEIREILQSKNDLFNSICSITIEELKQKLSILIKYSSNSKYRFLYNKAYNALCSESEEECLNTIADILFATYRKKTMSEK